MIHRIDHTCSTLWLLAVCGCAAAPPVGAPASPTPSHESPPTPAPATAQAERIAQLFADSGIADWTREPAPASEPLFEPPRAARYKLPNGLSVLAIPQRTLPIVSLALVVPAAGSGADPQGRAGLAAYTADLLDEGAGDLNAVELAHETARLGAQLHIGVSADAAQIALDTLRTTLPESLALLAKIVTQPRFERAEAERVKGDRATSLALRRDRPREVASVVLNRVLYGASHPYGHPSSGLREEFAGVTVAEARAFYRARWNPADMTLVVAGDVDPEQLLEPLRRTLGAFRGTAQPLKPEPAAKPAPAPAPARASETPARLLLVDRPGAAQSDVRVGLIGLDRKDPRFFAFEVYRTVLGDGFTSRLVQRLREQLGITYGVGANMDWRLRPGPLTIASAIVTAATAQGLAEIVRMIDELGAQAVPSVELDKAKQNMIRALPARFETNAKTAQTFAELALLGLPDDFYASYAEGVRNVTAADVKAAAASVVPSRRLTFAVVGDMTMTRTALEQLGLGAPALFDAEGKPLALR